MGNCCTTTSEKEEAENLQFSKQNRTPPPSHPLLLEEESVKEVLSETPSVPKRPAVFRTTHQEPRKFPPFLPTNPDGKSRNDREFKKPTMIFNSGELSEDASEISTATYFTENNEDEVAEIRQRSPAKLRNRSHSGEVKRERNSGRSPVKMSDPSPTRMRSGSGRDSRNLGSNNVQKRECGESSGRRSRSPAMRTDCGGGGKVALNRSGSVRKTGKSPGRVGEMIRNVDETNSMTSSKRESRDTKWPPTNNESLENPLVSLECFIFL